MNHRDRELSQLLSAIADQAGARLIAVQRTSGGHRKAVFTKGGHRRFVIAGSTPGDRRDRHNTAAVARRVLL
jgi:hypothetical protein